MEVAIRLSTLIYFEIFNFTHVGWVFNFERAVPGSHENSRGRVVQIICGSPARRATALDPYGRASPDQLGGSPRR